MNIRKLALGRCSLLLMAWALLSGCEAPLDLSGIEAQLAEPVRRFDQFKSAVVTDDRMVVVGDNGVILTSRNRGESWNRMELAGSPALVGIAACADGSIAALDRSGKVWVSQQTDKSFDVWISRTIDSEETPMAITCDTKGTLWVTASFSTILHSDNQGKSWTSTSMDEDMQLGTIQFVSDSYAVVTGEFGAFLVSRDSGQTWERGNDLPDEFFPLAAYFSDLDNGWVSGLSGTVLRTQDGGLSWARQPTSTQSPLYALVGKDDRIFAAGDSGALLQLTDEQWVDVEHQSHARSYYIAMALLGDEQLLVAGGGGAINVIPVISSIALEDSSIEVLADSDVLASEALLNKGTGTQRVEGAQL